MLVKDFYFDLPKELIAQEPSEKRDNCRLLVIDRKTGEYTDANMSDFVDFLDPDSIIVVNNTKVRKARVYGIADTGAKVEFLFLEDNGDGTYTAMTTKSKRQRIGKRYSFFRPDGTLYVNASIVGFADDELKIVKFDTDIDEEFFQVCGHVPLPPYIKREDNFKDEERYQTVYARDYGSVASPTAGLHYTPEIMQKIRDKGIEIIEITLHVGMGTFAPVRSENIEDHKMHFESYHVSEEAAKAINAARRAGKKIVATGTTSVRTLESAWDTETDSIKAGYGRTNIFIYPGYKYKAVDCLLTNFHTPESTLVALVSAFSSREIVMKAYAHAIEEKYHFFSYGDATFFK